MAQAIGTCQVYRRETPSVNRARRGRLTPTSDYRPTLDEEA